MSAAIDLGAMQQDVAKKKALLTAARRVLDGAIAKHDSAQKAMDAAREKHRRADAEHDNAKRAVVAAARQVADNG